MALASTFFIEPTGAVGTAPASGRARRGRGTTAGDGLEAELHPAVDARISTSAAAPSEIDEELAAVTVPSLEGRLQRRNLVHVLAKGRSSCVTTTSPFLPATVTGAISQSKLPSLLACLERVVERIENSLRLARGSLPAQSSAKVPIRRPRVSWP